MDIKLLTFSFTPPVRNEYQSDLLSQGHFITNIWNKANHQEGNSILQILLKYLTVTPLIQKKPAF
jgi:hypothetical protein